jgi:dihydrofolate reductase
MKPLVLVVAIGKNGAIGKDGKVPWRIPEDLKHFKAMTVGHAIIMGRKTWDEVGKPLKDRRNIVVSRARETDEEPRVIGGAEIYRLTLPYATKIYLTEVDRDVEADTYFTFDRAPFREAESRRGEDPTVRYVTLVRR